MKYSVLENCVYFSQFILCFYRCISFDFRFLFLLNSYVTVFFCFAELIDINIVNMPGANCSIFGCGTCRSKRNSDVGIFKLPTAKDAASVEWREKMIQVITRDRVADNLFKERLLKDKVFICEKHFKPEEILKCKFLVLVIF